MTTTIEEQYDHSFIDRDEFLTLCRLLVIGDKDGFGYYVKDGKIFSTDPAWPSQIIREGFNEKFSHVIWYFNH